MMQTTSWEDFNGAKVALLGAGSENIALIPYLQKAGAKVTVCDKQTRSDFPALGASVEPKIGADYLDNLDQYDVVFRIAGLPVATLEIALAKLKKRPVVTSPTDLFLALSPCRTVGVTGTKGKGTTATMIGSILKAAGKKVVVVGNIGQPIFDAYKDLDRETIAVIELSSFQLEDLNHSPDIAVILPIGEDHLQPLSPQNPNFHPTINDYVAAKAKIIQYQKSGDSLIYAADSELSSSIAEVAKSRKVSVSQLAEAADFFVSQAGTVSHAGTKLAELATLGLRGQHVFLNATMAIAASTALGCRAIDLQQGIISWRPLPHRMETVGDQNGVIFVDDSYATNPVATIAAIQSFDQPIIWIAGGSSKGADFDELSRVVAGSTVKQAILIGLEAPKIKDSMSHFAQKIPVDLPKNLIEAVKIAKKSAEKGDVVLLSPSCASTDMFQSAAERGNKFRELIEDRL